MPFPKKEGTDRFGVQAPPRPPLGQEGESRTCRGWWIAALRAAGAGTRAREGGVRKAIPAALRIAGPTRGAPISAGGGERPSQGHLCPSVPPSRPLPRRRPWGLSLLEAPFRLQGVAVPYSPVQGRRGRRGRVTAANPSFPHRVFPGANQPWHPVARRALPSALRPRGCAPGCCHCWGKGPPATDSPPSPCRQAGDGGRAGAAQAGDPLGRVPKGSGARAPLRRGPASWHNAGREQGEPRCHFTTWLSPLPPGVRRTGPRCGRHPWLAAGRGAGASGRRGWCFAVHTPPSCSFWFSCAVAGPYF